MARPKSYRNPVVWQKAMALALARRAFLLTENLPRREAYGLADQIRRAFVSIPSHMVEEYGRLSDLQFRHFWGHARGSLYEMQTQVELAAELGYLVAEDGRQWMEQGWEVARILNGLLKSLSPSARLVDAKASSAHSASTACSADKGPACFVKF